MTAPKAAHTPGPWTYRDQDNGNAPQMEFPTRIQFGRGGYDRGAVVGCVYIWQHDTEAAKANAARIVACVNACEGIATDQLAGLNLRECMEVQAKADDQTKAERDALRAEVERLREALQAVVDTQVQPHPAKEYEGHYLYASMLALEKARAALGGGKP